MNVLGRVHDTITVVFGSVADAGAVAIAFHVDTIVARAMMAAVVVHAAFGACIACQRWLHLRRLRKPARIVGFVPPVRTRS